jgi:hypothetical protein
MTPASILGCILGLLLLLAVVSRVRIPSSRIIVVQEQREQQPQSAPVQNIVVNPPSVHVEIRSEMRDLDAGAPVYADRWVPESTYMYNGSYKTYSS